LALATLLFGAACTSDYDPVSPGRDLGATSRGDKIHIVLLKEGVDAEAVARDLGRGHGFGARRVWEAVDGFSAFIPPGQLDAVRRDPRVERVVEDRIVRLIEPIRPNVNCNKNPNHPLCGGGGGGTAETTPWGVTRVGGPRSGVGKVAWVIDTGVDLDHPDLNVNPGCSVSFVTGRRGQSTSADDGNGHGTHVAGTIAAIDNERDVVGVAAGATVCSVRVLDNRGSGTFEWVMSGVDFVAANGDAGDVANMSLGAESGDETIDLAVVRAADKHIFFTIAAGNSGEDAMNHTPARVEHDWVYTVSAIGSNDCLASFSNYGSVVDFAAPGVGVTSLARGGGTTTFSGTSMAAPHVAGIRLLGNVASDGTACGDPAAPADPIAHY
jgi:subtilisin family serine protease